MEDRAKAIINSKNLVNNFHMVKQLAPSSKVLAMLKSNAYGHGMIEVGNVLTEADGFGVACIDEGINLRNNGFKSRIVLLGGAWDHQDILVAIRYSLDLVVHDFYQIKLLTSITTPLSVWLKMDTGMHRLGFLPEHFLNAYDQLLKNPNIKQPIILMTHLAEADDSNSVMTSKQIALFKKTIHSLASPISIANSAGILSWPQAIGQWNRPGIMLYGCSPMLNQVGKDHGLMPVMTLKSKIIALHDCDAGDAIGYGGSWVCLNQRRIAVVAIGYGDGYPRHAINGTPVLVGKRICPLVGRVSMDMITVDVTDCKEACVGDEVILWGDGLPAETVANYANTIVYELLCKVTKRVHFIYQ